MNIICVGKINLAAFFQNKRLLMLSCVLKSLFPLLLPFYTVLEVLSQVVVKRYKINLIKTLN